MKKQRPEKPGQDHIRLIAAVRPPDSALDPLLLAVNALGKRLSKPILHWLKLDQWHIPLHLYGHIHRDELPELRRSFDNALRGFSAPRLNYGPLDARWPRVIYDTVHGELDALNDLRMTIIDQTGHFGEHQPTQPLRPDLYLAYIRRRTPAEFLRKLGQLLKDIQVEPGDWPADDVVLLETQRDGEGYRFTPRWSIKLDWQTRA